MKQHRQTSEMYRLIVYSRKLTQLEDDDSWNIEWEQHCLIVSCTMHFTSWRVKSQLGIDSECQSDTLTTEPRTMSMKH